MKPYTVCVGVHRGILSSRRHTCVCVCVHAGCKTWWPLFCNGFLNHFKIADPDSGSQYVFFLQQAGVKTGTVAAEVWVSTGAGTSLRSHQANAAWLTPPRQGQRERHGAPAREPCHRLNRTPPPHVAGTNREPNHYTWGSEGSATCRRLFWKCTDHVSITINNKHIDTYINEM